MSGRVLSWGYAFLVLLFFAFFFRSFFLAAFSVWAFRWIGTSPAAASRRPWRPRGRRLMVTSGIGTSECLGLLAGLAVDEFPGDVEVADVPRVLLKQVEQDSPEGRRVFGPLEAAANAG